jgi:hypothetical protein
MRDDIARLRSEVRSVGAEEVTGGYLSLARSRVDGAVIEVSWDDDSGLTAQRARMICDR